MEHKDFETAVDAAKRFNVTVRAVQKWAAAGKIDGAKKSAEPGSYPKMPFFQMTPRKQKNKQKIIFQTGIS